MQVNTVNIVEIHDSTLNKITSFKDDPTGNKEAEALFIKVAKKLGAKKKDMDSYLDDGTFDSSDYINSVSIVHS
jgi:hypothetical protein